MALIYLFVVAYSLSWGPLVWVYMGEIFPTRLRDYGMAICSMMVWLMNYVVSKIAPIAILNIGWKTWMVCLSLSLPPLDENLSSDLYCDLDIWDC